MRRAESPYLADLFAISLRWLTLFGLAVSLGTSGALSSGPGGNPFPWTLAALTLPALWNAFVSSLAIFNRRLSQHRLINVGVDIFLAILLFFSAGGLHSGIFWVGLLPLFSAAVYFEIPGALAAALVTSLLQAGSIALSTPSPLPLLLIGIIAIFNLGAGVGVAFLCKPLLVRLRKTYQGTVNQRKEGERTVQRQERDRLRSLFAMIETLSATLNYQTVLEIILDTAMTALGNTAESNHELSAAVFLFGDQQELEMRASRGFISRDASVSLPAAQGALCETLKTGEALTVENPGLDPELSQFISLQSSTTALCLPLIRSMHAYGIILFTHQHPNFFTQERVETLQMLSNQAVISLQNARLYQDLALEKERLVQIQEEVQKKLARDLHDGPTQSVSSIAMRINIARKILEKSLNPSSSEPPNKRSTVVEGAVQQAIEELARVETLARRTTQEIRHMLFTLRPLVLESEGLEAALKTIADKTSDLYQQKIVVDIENEVVAQIDLSRQTVIFYLVEEALNNARKHAQAAEIWVHLKRLPGDPCIAALDIIDNGVGFDVQSVLSSYDRRGSLGMINLSERAELVNGILKINSLPGKGTRVRVLIPLNHEAADRLHQRR